MFDPEGKYVRSFGNEFQGGGHGLEVHEENGEEFLYVTGYQHLKNFAKLTLDGKTVWERHAPMESRHVRGRAKTPSPTARGAATASCPRTSRSIRPTATFTWPTATARTSIHRYDNDANYKSTFGKEGKGDGQFDLPHGVWIDRRTGREPSVVVADRVNARLQWFTLDGKHLETLDGFLLPANVDTFGDVMLVPDLQLAGHAARWREQSHRPAWAMTRPGAKT